MEEVLLRFPYVGEEIFDLLDEKSLEKWKKYAKPGNFSLKIKTESLPGFKT